MQPTTLPSAAPFSPSSESDSLISGSFSSALREMTSCEPLKGIYLEQTNKFLSLIEARNVFWAKLYELPFIQDRIIEGLNRVKEGQVTAKTVVFHYRSSLDAQDDAGSAQELDARVRKVLTEIEHVKNNQAATTESKRKTIAGLLVQVPIEPHEALELCADFKKMVRELEDLKDTSSQVGQKTTSSRSLDIGSPNKNRYDELVTACGGTGSEASRFYSELVELQKPYLELKDDLVNTNLGFVRSYIRGQGTGVSDNDDLFQRGVLGLMSAIERFDPGLSFKLTTYAGFLIRSEMQCERANNGYVARIPQNRIEAVKDVSNDGVGQADRTAAGVNHEEIYRADLAGVAALMVSHSLDAPLGTDASVSRMALCSDPKAKRPLDLVVARELRAIVWSAVTELGDSQQSLIVGHFGLHDDSNLGDEEIRKAVGIDQPGKKDLRSPLKALKEKLADTHL